METYDLYKLKETDEICYIHSRGVDAVVYEYDIQEGK